MNNFVKTNEDLQNKTLEEIIKTSSGGIFNNAAQVWNHDFFWQSMNPQGGHFSDCPLKQAVINKVIIKNIFLILVGLSRWF